MAKLQQMSIDIVIALLNIYTVCFVNISIAKGKHICESAYVIVR